MVKSLPFYISVNTAKCYHVVTYFSFVSPGLGLGLDIRLRFNVRLRLGGRFRLGGKFKLGGRFRLRLGPGFRLSAIFRPTDLLYISKCY